MAAGPVFFVDRSLGRRIVPRILHEAGWDVVVHDEVFAGRAESVSDEEWLTLAGERSWCVLMKDARIRYRPTERESLRAGGVHAFCLSREIWPDPRRPECSYGTRAIYGLRPRAWGTSRGRERHGGDARRVQADPRLTCPGTK